ncbi:MAG: 50S ribosomal protein L16 [Candidatus Pacearchaeota archaeon]
MTIKNPAPYRKLQMPYTRKSRVKSKSYIKTVPPVAVVKFVMGNSKKWNTDGFQYKVFILSEADGQIRDVAIEASRQQILREITEKIGNDFYFAVSTYPHHMLREHKQAAVAQADRMSQGMTLSFGKTAGRAAQVHKGKPIFIIGVSTENAVAKLREIYNITKAKLPIPTRFEVQKIKV